MKALLSAVLVCTLTGTLHAAVDTPGESGNAFLRMCSVIDKDDAGKTGREKMQEVACVGYINGVGDGVEASITFAQVQNSSVRKPYCLPSDAENGQLVRIVLKYVKGHPELAHMPTAGLVMLALQEAFPCR